MLTPLALIRSDGGASAASPTGLAEASPGASACLSDEGPSSKVLESSSFLLDFSLLGLAV